MKQSTRFFTLSVFSSLVFSVLIAAGTVSAQPATTIVPAPSGEPSTESAAGVPNPTQRPNGSMPASRSAIKAEARAQNKNPANSDTPMGEASTVRNGQPNATPRPKSGISRDEVRNSAAKSRQPMSVKGEKPDVPTNPSTNDGTPK